MVLEVLPVTVMSARAGVGIMMGSAHSQTGTRNLFATTRQQDGRAA